MKKETHGFDNPKVVARLMPVVEGGACFPPEHEALCHGLFLSGFYCRSSVNKATAAKQTT